MQFNRPAIEDDLKVLPGLIAKLSSAYKDAVNVALAFPHVKYVAYLKPVFVKILFL